MNSEKTYWPVALMISVGFAAGLIACSAQEQCRVVDTDSLLPEGATAEISHAYPDFRVTLVSDEEANVSVKFGEQSLHVDGVENEEARERMARYVLQYLENTNKCAEDRAKREAYQKLPPREKMANLIGRIKQRHPNFDYEWTGAGEGNVKATYGDNSLLMTGIEHDGAREEWAHAIIQIQKEIDKTSKGDAEERALK